MSATKWDGPDRSEPQDRLRQVTPSRLSLSEKPERRPSTDRTRPNIRLERPSTREEYRQPRSEAFGRPFAPAPLEAEGEDAALKSLLRRLDPEAVPEPAPPTPVEEWTQRRRMFLAVAGVGAMFGLAVGVGVIFLSISQTATVRNDTAVPATAIAAPAAIAEEVPPNLSQPPAADAPMVVEPQSRSIANKSDQSPQGEQPDRLLQQFMQWRQKTGSTPR